MKLPLDTDDARGMESTRIVYASVARADLGYADVMAMLLTAADRNARRSITGALCFADGKFLQLFEGARPVVSALFTRIANDPRHTQLELLLCEPVTTRLFSDWSMKLIGTDGAPTAPRPQLLDLYTGSQRFDPHAMSAETAVAFLRELGGSETPIAA
jgi:hypothetical protein